MTDKYCKRGHLKSIDNLYKPNSKNPACKLCVLMKSREYYNTRRNDPEFMKRKRISSHNRSIEIKIKVFAHYCGGIDKIKCQCPKCDINQVKFLTIHHINNDGAKHRKEIGSGGRAICEWILKNNFPNMFQVLCFNCNCALHHSGSCHV